MPNIMHTDLAAKDSSTHKSLINVSNSNTKPGELTDALSSDDAVASNEAL